MGHAIEAGALRLLHELERTSEMVKDLGLT